MAGRLRESPIRAVWPGAIPRTRACRYCRRESVIKARGTGSQPRVRFLMRSTPCSGVDSLLTRSKGDEAGVSVIHQPAIAGGRRRCGAALAALSMRAQRRGQSLRSRNDIALQFRCRDERAATVLLGGDQSFADTFVKRCAADAQDARRLRDLESQVRERFNSRGHARLQLDTNGLVKVWVAGDIDNVRGLVRQPAPE
jgi:hypothetical protein